MLSTNVAQVRGEADKVMHIYIILSLKFFHLPSSSLQVNTEEK